MISKEELLKQKTKKDDDMEKLERVIDNNLRKIYPDCIKDEEIKFKRMSLDIDADEKLIETVLNKYIEQGGYKSFEYKINSIGLFYINLDIILKL